MGCQPVSLARLAHGSPLQSGSVLMFDEPPCVALTAQTMSTSTRPRSASYGATALTERRSRPGRASWPCTLGYVHQLATDRAEPRADGRARPRPCLLPLGASRDAGHAPLSAQIDATILDHVHGYRWSDMAPLKIAVQRFSEQLSGGDSDKMLFGCTRLMVRALSHRTTEPVADHFAQDYQDADLAHSGQAAAASQTS